MDISTRNKDRQPYEDWHSEGSEFSGDSSSDEFVLGRDFDDEEIPDSEKKRRKKEHSSDRVPRPAGGQASRRFKVKLDFLSAGQANKILTKSTDPKALLSPTGTPVRCIPFSQIKPTLLDPATYFRPNENGINLLLPLYDPTSPNTPQFFGVESQVPLFDLKYLSNLSNAELDTELEAVEKELADVGTIDERLILVSPFDHRLKQSISIQKNVNEINWLELHEMTGNIDVILMDPPWKIQDARNPTRGLALDYEQMEDNDIGYMELECIQKNGFLFMWVVAARVPIAATYFEKWGYRIINQINWIKTTRKGLYAPSNGHYLLHSKETCIVGVKGTGFDGIVPKFFNDLVVCPRNVRQSHKPIELYEMIEKCFPDGIYLEIFARAHNIRDGWISIGLEVPT